MPLFNYKLIKLAGQIYMFYTIAPLAFQLE
jgi:hypothetical protein